VVRNRVKRRLRDLFRRHRASLDVGMDFVVNAHPSAVGRGYDELEREFVRALERLAARGGR
jgi:ribonuclease P protein component